MRPCAAFAEPTAAPGSRKAPAVADKMLGMVATAPDKLAVLRDQALLLIGFGGALRSSELVALNVWNISRIPNPDRISLSFERP